MKEKIHEPNEYLNKGAFSRAIFFFGKDQLSQKLWQVFAFTHSNEKLKRKFVEESLLTYFVT